VQIRSDSPSIQLDAKVLPRSFPVSFQTYVQPYHPKAGFHCHNCLELGLCLEGSGIEMIDNRAYAFSRTLSIIHSGCIHDSHILSVSPEQAHSVWQFIFVDLQALGIPARSYGGFLSDDAQLITLFQMMYGELERREEGYQQAFLSLLAALLIHADRLAPAVLPQLRSHFSGEMAHILHYITENYAQPLSIAQLARQCSMSESTFCRLFRRAMGIPPLAFIQRVRMTVAQHMLENTDCSIAQIAQDAGFRTLSSFNRLFLRQFGCSPRAMRQRRER